MGLHDINMALALASDMLDDYCCVFWIDIIDELIVVFPCLQTTPEVWMCVYFGDKGKDDEGRAITGIGVQLCWRIASIATGNEPVDD